MQKETICSIPRLPMFGNIEGKVNHLRKEERKAFSPLNIDPDPKRLAGMGHSGIWMELIMRVGFFSLGMAGL